MSYLNPPYPNNFQELCAAMPLYYLDVFEMRAILRAQGYLLDGVCDGMEKLVDVNFILTADEATIRQWEKGLKIAYKSRLTLDQRKRVVISYIIGLGHIGEREIRAIIGQYTPNHVDFDFLRGTISILVEGEIFDEENLLETLLRRIPAHLGLKISIHIRREFRQTIPFAQGGAVGSYFFLEPVTRQHHTAALPLNLSQAGFDRAKLTAAPPTPAEVVRTDFPLSQAAGGYSKQTAHPPTPQEATTTRYDLYHGAATLSDMAGDTPQVQRAAQNQILTGQGALESSWLPSDTPTTDRASTGRQKAAGGLFCHTHIKSKRIE